MKPYFIMVILMISFAVSARSEEGVSICEIKEIKIKAAGLENLVTQQNEAVFKSISSSFGDAREAQVRYDDSVATQIIVVRDGGEFNETYLRSEHPLAQIVVRYSYRELEEMRDKIDKLFQSLTLSGQFSVVNSIEIDEQYNSLRVRGDERNLDFIRIQLEENGFDTSAIFIEKGGRVRLIWTTSAASKDCASVVPIPLADLLHWFPNTRGGSVQAANKAGVRACHFL